MTNERTNERTNGGEIKGPFGFHPGPITKSIKSIKAICFIKKRKLGVFLKPVMPYLSKSKFVFESVLGKIK